MLLHYHAKHTFNSPRPAYIIKKLLQNRSKSKLEEKIYAYKKYNTKYILPCFSCQTFVKGTIL